MVTRRSITTLAIAASMALTLGPALAQESPDPFDPAQFDGIEEAVNRSWSVDFEALMDAMTTPGAEMPGMDGLLLASGAVMQFEDVAAAEEAFETIAETDPADLAGDMELTSDANATSGDIDDLGDEGVLFELAGETNDQDVRVVVAVALEDDVLFFGITAAGADGDDGVAMAVLEYLVEEGEASDEEVDFSADGSSTGGLWDYFPPDDFEAFDGLTPLGDAQLYPAGEDSN